MSTPRYRTTLRILLGAILQANLSDRDLSYLASELRRGQLPDELAYLIEQTSNHFYEVPGGNMNDSNINLAEYKIKKKRLPKKSIVNIIRSIDGDIHNTVSENMTMRDILNRFFSNAPQKKASQLLDILDSSGGSDPYLKGISETRR